MAAPIEFQIKILGGAAPELDRVAGGFDKSDKGARKAAEGVKIFEGEVGSLKSELGGLSINLDALSGSGVLFAFDLAEGVKAAVQVIGELVHGVFDLGREIANVAGAAQDLDLALNLKVGEQGTAQVEELAQQFKGTRFTPDMVKRGILPLLDIGLNNDKGLIGDLATVAADLETRTAGRQKFAETLEGFQHLALRGQISPKMLVPLGIGADEYFTALAGALHTDVETAKARAKKGLVEKDLALSTLVSVIGQREGGTIGAAALEGGETLGGTLERLRNLPETIFSQLAHTEGVEHLNDVLKKFVDVMTGPGGERLVKMLANGIEHLTNAIETGDIEGTVNRILDAFAAIGPVLVGLGDLFSPFVDSVASTGDEISYFTSLFKDLSDAADDIDKVFDSLGRWADELDAKVSEAFEHVAHDIAELPAKIAQGLSGMGGQIVDATAHAGHDLVAGFKATLGIHSPSRVFAEIGDYSAQGWAEGFTGGANDNALPAMRAAVRSVTEIIGTPVGSSPASPAAAPSSVSIGPIIVEGKGSPVETAEAVRVELEKLLIRTGLANGVAA